MNTHGRHRKKGPPSRVARAVTTIFAALLALLACVPTLRAYSDHGVVLTGGDILELHRLGIGDEVIIEAIRASSCDFDADPDSIKALSAAGLSDAVLAEMLRASSGAPSEPADSHTPALSHKPGVYLRRDSASGPVLVPLSPSVSLRSKTGGYWRNLFSLGVAKVKNRAVIDGPCSDLLIEHRRPVFQFRFGTTETEFGGSSPAEFALVRMRLKGGDREVILGTSNIAGGEAGAPEKFLVPFEIEEVAPGTFLVVPSQDLPDGEYGFYSAGGGGAPVGPYYTAPTGDVKVFDFSIRVRSR